MRLLFDSNILIDLLNGQIAGREAVNRTTERYISIITWIEILSGTLDQEAEDVARLVLGRFHVVPVSDDIAEESVRIRRNKRLKLPDAIILASARRTGAQLVTRNTKDFRPTDPDIIIPYSL